MKHKIQIISFSGVDGAGKTTILREFTRILEDKYNYKVKELRHRPSILPILSAIKYGKTAASEKTLEVLPRTGNNKSKLSSTIRFFYYFTDYVLGQWYIYIKYTRKNILVIYDRYYFDFIVDPRRTNIDLNSKFIKWFYRLIFKPELNVFLFASPEIILSRKQEMDEASIQKLTLNYIKLFDSLNSTNKGNYICIENVVLSETINIIENQLMQLKND